MTPLKRSNTIAARMGHGARATARPRSSGGSHSSSRPS